MNILPLLLASLETPGGLWSILINWFHSGIGNFGWTVLLVTLFVKLICSPLDFLVKFNTKKQTLVQQKCSPQVSKIQKKFGNDQQKARIQINALYKKEGLNMGRGCLITIVNMIISLTLFFTFYSSLRTNSAYQAITQYETLATVYIDKTHEILVAKNNDITEYDIVDAESADLFIADYNKATEIYNKVQEGKQDEIDLSQDTHDLNYYLNLYDKYKVLVSTDILNETSTAVVNKWNEIKSSWLWVTNIWVADATIYPFQTYSNLIELAQSGGYAEYVTQNINEVEYTTISNIVNLQGGKSKNGYFILAILAAVITFLSQFMMERSNKLKSKNANTIANQSMEQSMQISMKIMKFIMPVIMISFVLRSSASFGIYILASNVAAIGFGEICNLIINKLTKQKQQEVEEVLEKEAQRLIKKGKLQEKK